MKWYLLTAITNVQVQVEHLLLKNSSICQISLSNYTSLLPFVFNNFIIALSSSSSTKMNGSEKRFRCKRLSYRRYGLLLHRVIDRTLLSDIPLSVWHTTLSHTHLYERASTFSTWPDIVISALSADSNFSMLSRAHLCCWPRVLLLLVSVQGSV